MQTVEQTFTALKDAVPNGLVPRRRSTPSFGAVIRRFAALGLIVAAAIAGACGEGRAIFNVDVQSFLAASGNDTVEYPIVPPGGIDTSSAPQKVNLIEGLGGSVVEEVTFTGAVQFQNDSGNVTLGLRVFIDTSAAAVLNPSDTAINIPPTALSGADTVTVPISGNLTGAVANLFTKPELWFRVAIAGNNPGPGVAGGKAIVTSLQLRIVMQENIF